MIHANSQGFTLIEFVVIILIASILVVVTIFQFINVNPGTSNAAISNVASALSSANAINYNARHEDSANGVPVTACSDVVNALQSGTLPANYSVDTVAISPATTGTTMTTCVLTYTPPHHGAALTKNFSATYIQ